jgi:5-methylcytosine-specific restriction enzyme subunit McrC
MHLIVREHEEIAVVAQRHDGERALHMAEADALWLMCERQKVAAMSWANRAVKFSHHCGVIQVGSLVVEILPKIADDDGFDRTVLLHMIDLACDFPLRGQDADRIAIGSPHLLGALMRWFCQELFLQFHQGLLRTYVTESDTLTSVRGRWRPDIDAWRHAGRPDRLQCEYDELTTNNAYNQVIKAALRRVQAVASGLPAIARDVTKLLGWLVDVDDVTGAEVMLDRLVSSRLTRRYDRVLMMARWFLAGESPDLQRGRRTSIALLFDMNALFQATLASAVRQVAPPGLTVRENGPRRHLAVDIHGNDRVPLKPDLTLMQGDTAVAIIDAKWKRLDPQAGGALRGLNPADVYQMHAYAAAYDCPRVALWFPGQVGQPASAGKPHYRWSIAGVPVAASSLAIDWVDLGVPAASGANWRRDVCKQVADGLGRLLLR